MAGVAVLSLPGAASQQVRRQRRAAARVSPGVVQSRWRRVDLGARRVGGRSAQRASTDLRAACALSKAARVPVDDDADRAAAGAPQRVGRRRGLLLSVRLDVHRAPHAERRQAAAVRDDRDRDLAEPASRVPAAPHQDGDGERPHLVPFVPALSDDPSVHQARARRHRSLLRAGRGDRAAAGRTWRRSGAGDGHRQPEVRFASTRRRRRAAAASGCSAFSASRRTVRSSSRAAR